MRPQFDTHSSARLAYMQVLDPGVWTRTGKYRNCACKCMCCMPDTTTASVRMAQQLTLRLQDLAQKNSQSLQGIGTAATAHGNRNAVAGQADTVVLIESHTHASKIRTSRCVNASEQAMKHAMHAAVHRSSRQCIASSTEMTDVYTSSTEF